MAKSKANKPKVLPLNVEEIDFKTILPVWTNLLWPGRASAIMPVSTMMFLGGYDLTIRDKYNSQAKFYGAYDADGTMIGVFSGHPTSDTEYRARGLYVVPSFQQLGIGAGLVQLVYDVATAAGREICWCIPRVANVPFFEKCGFTAMSPPFSDGVEFGPNVYMARAITQF